MATAALGQTVRVHPAAPTVAPARPHGARAVLRLPDPDRIWTGVRIRADVPLPFRDFSLSRDAWTLPLVIDTADRIEYLLELTDAHGTRTEPDPVNPLRAPGAFGDKSVVELPGYQRPAWLEEPAPEGHFRDVQIHARALDDAIPVRLWTPAGTADAQPLPMLVVHDGPEYDALARITTWAAAGIAAGRLPRARVALLSPGPRNERYSGGTPYSRALALAVVPRLGRLAPTTRRIGVGASLGALSLLTVHRRFPRTFDGLFLQAGSFFHPAHDAHERRFPFYDRVIDAVDQVLRADGTPRAIPVTMTCGLAEENLANNRIMVRALRAQGYDAELVESRDAHNYIAWRDCLEPHLTELVRKVLG